jgi:hypothetical protein
MMEQIAKGNRNVKDIALALKKSKGQIYRAGKKLIENRFLVISNGIYEPTRNTIPSMLMAILSESPPLIQILSGSGLELLTILVEPKGISEIIKNSSIKKAQVFKKIKQARSISLVKKIEKKYVINEKLWHNVIDFLKELRKYENTIDPRIPANSVIYFKNKEEIVFSTKEKINAPLTAFSAYERFGIKILTNKHYYYLPNKTLTKKEVFMHSLHIAEKEPDPRNIIFIALFYAKYKKEISIIRNEILNNIDKIFSGNNIPRYPTLDEIKDRAEVYDIKI